MSYRRRPGRARRVALGAAAVALSVAGSAALGAPAAAASTSAPAAIASTGAGAQASPAWTSVFVDNFSGAAGAPPSNARWRYDIGTGYGTGEVDRTTRSARNVSLDGRGDLKMTALRDANGNWTSSRIETNRDDFAAAPGKILQVSARISMPGATGAAGEGYWPAFWMLGTPFRQGSGWPGVGEFDILEDVNDQDLAYGTMHCGVNPGGPCDEPYGLGGKRACPGSTCSGNFHTYSLQWDRSVSPEQLRWYVDGTQYWSVDSSQMDSQTWADATHRGAFVILDLAMGGAFPNGIAGHDTPTSATVSGGSMLVDYVSVKTT